MAIGVLVSIWWFGLAALSLTSYGSGGSSNNTNNNQSRLTRAFPARRRRHRRSLVRPASGAHTNIAGLAKYTAQIGGSVRSRSGPTFCFSTNTHTQTDRRAHTTTTTATAKTRTRIDGSNACDVAFPPLRRPSWPLCCPLVARAGSLGEEFDCNTHCRPQFAA